MCTTYFYEFAKDFQTLLAGILAIAAALIAYRGALRQATAASQASERLHKEAARASAAAFFAELSQCGLTAIAVKNRLTPWDEHAGIPPPLLRFDTGIFDANQAAVGSLPADEAYAVALTYKILKSLDSEWGRILLSNWPVTGANKSHLVGRAESARKTIHATLKGIYQTAGLESDKAHRVIAAVE